MRAITASFIGGCVGGSGVARSGWNERRLTREGSSVVSLRRTAGSHVALKLKWLGNQTSENA
jgi:hypothetical protein